MTRGRRLLALIVLVALPHAAAAQTSSGTISGRVVDAQDQAVPGATVTASTAG